MLNQNLSKEDKSYFIKMKKVFAGLMILFIAALVAFFAAKFMNEIKSSKFIGQDIMPVNTISVSAEGEIFVRPDVAEITLSIVRETDTAIEAQNQNAETTNKVVKFLKESGVEDKDIRTTNYSLNPIYDYLRDKGRVFKGYEARQNLEVKIRKLDEAGKILAGAAEHGANQVGGLSFTVDNEEEVKSQARKIAIDKAKEKAKTLAEDLSVSLIRLVSFNESGGGWPVPMPLKFGLGGAVAESAIAPEIPSGENKITVNVTLTYEIK